MSGYLTEYGKQLLSTGTTGVAMYDDDIPKSPYATRLFYLDPDFSDPWLEGPNRDYEHSRQKGIRISADRRRGTRRDGTK